MLKRMILHDVIRLWVLLTTCLLGGLILNEMRPKPLDLVYVPPHARLGQSVARLGASASVTTVPDGDVARDELERLVADRGALILDARPEVFYRIGHIPTALSLARDDFDVRYPVLKASLQVWGSLPLIVYCSSSECDDSRMVADALHKLGYMHVRVFRGGWYDWTGANLPQEKEP